MFFFGGADFFFAKRLFFRYGEGCEGRALRATVAGEWGYNGENSFSAFIPIRLPTIGRQPSHPHRSGFFIRFMPQESPPACGSTPDPALQAIAVVVILRRRLYFRCTPQKRACIGVLNERAGARRIKKKGRGGICG